MPNDSKRSRKNGMKKWKWSVQNLERILGNRFLKFVVLEAKLAYKLALFGWKKLDN